MNRLLLFAIIPITALLGFVAGLSMKPPSEPAEPVAPAVPALAAEGEYIPNTEELAEHEMRIIALGTGLPFPRPDQAATSWLVELGNGEKFLFDMGTGSNANFNALEIPYDRLTAAFVSHLHSDHVGDFHAYWISGWTSSSLSGAGRESLELWGPSGARPEYGTRHFVEKQLESFDWDADSRHGLLLAAGAKVAVHEFDYSKVQTVYERNGVRVVSFPMVHIHDGAVGYRLEWNGLSFVYSGDGTASRWLVENGRNADVLVHETFPGPSEGEMPTEMPHPDMLIRIIMYAHTPTLVVGRLFEMTKPRLAVPYHFVSTPEVNARVEAAIRRSYTGPLALAKDFLVINVSQDEIRVRTAVPNRMPRQSMPEAYASDVGEPDTSREEPAEISEWLAEGRIDFGEMGLPQASGVRGVAMKAALTVMMRDFPEGVQPDDLMNAIAEDVGED